MEAEPETKVIARESSTKEESTPAVAAPRESPRPEPPPGAPSVGKTVGRYELIHRLGHGGMAAVYLGRATGRAGFEKLVAVKVIHPHLAAEPEFVEMFLDEARIAARLHHPHIVEIHDLGEDEGSFFMVMEYVEGETLASLLRQLRKNDERLPLAAVLQVMNDACEGLAAAHELTHADGRPMHLVHRDVSPHNLLVGMDGRVKVVDFGIAKATGRRSSTRTGQLRGKLAYMSPEQARGESIDHRTDLFALGAVLWELLTNERLFMAETESETLARVTACEVPDIRDKRDDLPAEVVDLVRRSLARDADERYATAQDMLRDMRVQLRALSGEHEPREELAGVMDRLFSARIKYIHAAMRRASTSTGPRREVAANDHISPYDATQAAAEREASESRRASTGSQPVIGVGTHTHTLTASLAAAPARHWSLWLLLPLIGAAVGAAIVTRGSLSDSEPAQAQATEVAAPPEATPPPEETDSEPKAPSEPVIIKWRFDTSPTGATITLDGKVHPEPTPTTVELPRGDEAIEVEIAKEGYETLVLHPAPLASGNFREQLRPEAAVADENTKATTGRPRFKARTKPKKDDEGKATSTEPDTKATKAAKKDPGGLAPDPDWDALGKGKGRP